MIYVLVQECNFLKQGFLVMNIFCPPKQTQYCRKLAQ